LITFFGISVRQASKDTAKYGEMAPAYLQYDSSAELYVSTPKFRSVFPTRNSLRHLSGPFDVGNRRGGAGVNDGHLHVVGRDGQELLV
jgi:hypothetical protein